MNSKLLGKSVERREGHLKITGKAKYIDDIRFEDILYGATIRSTIARGKIKKINFDKKIPWSEFVIVTAKDIPGKNHVALILNDQPYLADGVVQHPEEPILLLAHRDKYLLEKAKKSIEIEYEEFPAIFSIEDALKAKKIIWGKDNVFKTFNVIKGNVDSIWKNAHKVIEAEYYTGAQEQLYIENNGMVAVANSKDGVTVWGSMQCPYYVHKALVSLFNVDESEIRVIQTETGGGFGGKEEYPSLIAGHAALLAWKSGKKIKLIYSRDEDMVSTTKRHPSRTRHKTAIDENGKILAMEIEFVIDGGAYCTLSPVVLSRGTIHAAGPYFCENIKITSRAVATNTPPHGAFRGFGAPQSIFALERHMDFIADQMNMCPVEFRKKNLLKKGQKTATNQIIRDEVDLSKVLELALKKSDYYKRKSEFEKFNASSKKKKRGVGLAVFFHGAGFTGSGEKHLSSKVAVEATKEGLVSVLSASTEIGQGTNTIFSQIAADALGIEIEGVCVAQPDTKNVPNSGPTVASRTCMIVGELVEKAAIELRNTLKDAGFLKSKYSSPQFKKACKAYVKKFGSLKCLSEYKQPNYIEWDDQKYQGDAYCTYAWACYVSQVEVDLQTYETRVLKIDAIQEVGKVVNPIMAQGQIEGGVAQGVGYALYEKVVWKNGRMDNGQMTNYIMPTAADVPLIRVYFIESKSKHGPGGAKGIGELPMDGPAPSILNAIEHATAVCARSIPFLPEDMMRMYENI